ncbi:MAG: TauD/TfdA dioxygenase family protein [Acidimicrobiales bacterium]
MPIDVQPMTATIGAEVFGIDLADVSAEEVDELRKAWLDWKVLFFRDQPITIEQHIDFGRLFGELEIHPFAPDDAEHPEIVVIESNDKAQYAASRWHSDVTWRQEPSLGSILRGRVIPPAGGDTCFADAAAAYDRLSDDWKERVDGLVAVHDFTKTFGRRLSPEKLAEKQKQYPVARHPVIRTHPDTGAKVIYTNRSFVSHIEGVDDDESREIVAHLEQAVQDPSVQCRFRWQVDSFAMWDNRCTQHCATNDFFPETRRVERVTIVGDKPF